MGNLIHRILSLCAKANIAPPNPFPVPSAPEGYQDAFERFEFDNALDSVWQIISRTNQDIVRKKPWEQLKQKDLDTLKSNLSDWLNAIHQIAYWLQPFLPHSSAKILSALSRSPLQPIDPLFPK